jgi:hypothetical protein
MDFAAVMLVQELIGLTLFIADCGYKLRISFDWQSLKKMPAAERLNQENTRARLKGIKKVWNLV